MSGRETLRAPDELDDDRLATGATGARRLIADEDAAALRDAITALPPKQRGCAHIPTTAPTATNNAMPPPATR